MAQLKQATTYPAIVGRVLEKRRKDRNWDQAQMAAVVGVTQSTWSKVENGTIALSIDHLSKAAKALEFEPGQLLGEADRVAKALPRHGVQVEAERIEDPIDNGILLVGAAALTLLVLLILAGKK